MFCFFLSHVTLCCKTLGRGYLFLQGDGTGVWWGTPGVGRPVCGRESCPPYVPSCCGPSGSGRKHYLPVQLFPLEPGNIPSHSHRPEGTILPGPHVSSGPLVLRLRGPSLYFEAEKPTVLSARNQSVCTNPPVVLGPRETEWGQNWGQGLVGVTIFFQRKI